VAAAFRFAAAASPAVSPAADKGPTAASSASACAGDAAAGLPGAYAGGLVGHTAPAGGGRLAMTSFAWPSTCMCLRDLVMYPQA